ncbi:MAG: leucyl aminopeptidase family protein [Bdellovibrionales bacterium]|nr:leucyl aminopeptidase family protein [Bdellovibrionales bacterium]
MAQKKNPNKKVVSKTKKKRKDADLSTYPIQGLKQLLHSQNYLDCAKIVSPTDAVADGTVRLFVFAKPDPKKFRKIVERWPKWQIEKSINSNEVWITGAGPDGPETICQSWLSLCEDSEHYSQLTPSSFGLSRDLVGQWLLQQPDAPIYVEFIEAASEFIYGGLVGLGVASYRYLKAAQGQMMSSLYVSSSPKKLRVTDLDKARQLSSATNFCRHLVNAPANILNPKSYTQILKSYFQRAKNFKVEIWEEPQLKKENAGLLLAVGQGAATPPALVRLSYRPAGSKKKPIAFVGKGITFDTGGLDIKPSSGMRIMKKDMGGSAALAGLAYWVAEAQPKRPCDFYFSLAENAVSAYSMRPGDVIQSRNGITVEIDNTDAEGRLVLADALDVASRQKEKPSAIIDVATLTGAIKMGLGSEIPGLFCNSDSLSEKLLLSWQEKGELLWRMPLFHQHKRKLQSFVANTANSASGFGGAIRAAVFLEQFVDNSIPWAHFDIYAWADSPSGAIAEVGASGQAVQGLVGFLEK